MIWPNRRTAVALSLLVVLCGGSTHAKGEDPPTHFAHVEQVRSGQKTVSTAPAQTVRQGVGSKFVEPTSIQRPGAIAYRPFDMVDASGKRIDPQTTMVLSNGRAVTAQEFYASLNRIEQGLNKVGHSLRETAPMIVLSGDYADQVAIQKQVSDYTKSVGNTSGPKSASGNIGVAETSQISKILSPGTTIGNNASSSYAWTFDKTFGDNSMGVRLTAGLTVNAQSVNSANPPSMKGSTTTLGATFKGSCDGTLLGNQFNLLSGTCQIGTSSATGKVGVGWNLSVAGYQVLSDNKSYDASYTWSDSYSIPFQRQSQTMEFPIFGPFACSGFIGVEGEAGIKANLTLNPIYAEAEVVPFVKAGVYGEVDAGLDVEVASAWGGLHADLTLVDDEFTLRTHIGIVAQPGNKVGWRDELYVQNKLNLFTGTLSLVAHVFGPGGVKIQDFSYPFYTVPGYTDSRILYQVGSTNALPWVGN